MSAIDPRPSADLWQLPEAAPLNEHLLVWVTNGVRVAYRDDLGQWRKLWGGPCNAPKAWMFTPEPPK